MRLHLVLCLVAGSLVLPTLLCAQPSAPMDTARGAAYPHYLYEPLPGAPGEHVMNLGLSFSLLPEPIVE